MSTQGQNSDCDKHAQNTDPCENQPGFPTDTTLQSEVWLAFWQAEEMSEIDISQVEVIVRNCEVWLSGIVTDSHQKHLAECLVCGLGEVTCCHNELVVQENSQPG